MRYIYICVCVCVCEGIDRVFADRVRHCTNDDMVLAN